MKAAGGHGRAQPGPHRFVEERTKVGFFTDPTLCIGCKACEVACKEWNQVPADGYDFTGLSYDNTGELGASTWRHVQFLEADEAMGSQKLVPQDNGPLSGEEPFSWLFLSEVCFHCEVAGCLEHCPTGAIVRTEPGAVVVQDDICNGCGYCVVGCPFGVVDVRPKAKDGGGGAFKCTFCYDRQREGLVPACAQTCPTDSIRFGPLDELRKDAEARTAQLRERGYQDAHVYDPQDTSVEGVHALSLLIGDAHRYGLPRRPQVPTALQASSWVSAVATSAAALGLTLLAFVAL